MQGLFAEWDAAQFAWGDVGERCVYVCLYVYSAFSVLQNSTSFNGLKPVKGLTTATKNNRIANIVF